MKQTVSLNSSDGSYSLAIKLKVMLELRESHEPSWQLDCKPVYWGTKLIALFYDCFNCKWKIHLPVCKMSTRSCLLKKNKKQNIPCVKKEQNMILDFMDLDAVFGTGLILKPWVVFRFWFIFLILIKKKKKKGESTLPDAQVIWYIFSYSHVEVTTYNWLTWSKRLLMCQEQTTAQFL